jgi:hypothetical protein
MTVNVPAVPEQTVSLLTVGLGFIVIVPDAEALQPRTVVAVTVYVPA